jgi:cobalamin biosynthesis Co2+ chelatase CbiK
MQEENLSYFRELFTSNSDKGTHAYIYRTDRDVFRDVREKEDIRIVSPSQTLLDLAGMGYSAMDITKQLVLVYATI